VRAWRRRARSSTIDAEEEVRAALHRPSNKVACAVTSIPQRIASRLIVSAFRKASLVPWGRRGNSRTCLPSCAAGPGGVPRVRSHGPGLRPGQDRATPPIPHAFGWLPLEHRQVRAGQMGHRFGSADNQGAIEGLDGRGASILRPRFTEGTLTPAMAATVFTLTCKGTVIRRRIVVAAPVVDGHTRHASCAVTASGKT